MISRPTAGEINCVFIIDLHDPSLMIITLNKVILYEFDICLCPNNFGISCFPSVKQSACAFCDNAINCQHDALHYLRIVYFSEGKVFLRLILNFIFFIALIWSVNRI